MSSPEMGKPKAAAKSVKTAGKSAAAGTKAHGKKATGELSGEDKAHFVKAMWEGVKPPETEGSVHAPHVEVLRRIPAPTTPASRQTPESDEARQFAARLEAKLAAGELDVLTPEAMQSLMAVLVKLYSASAEEGHRYPIVQGRMSVTGTDAMIACGALLKAVDLQVFELGMWQSWSGM